MRRLFMLATIFVIPFMGWATEQKKGLLFTCRKQETSQQSTLLALPAINEVRSNEVQYVVPKETVNPPFDYVSWQYGTSLNYNFLAGTRPGDPYYQFRENLFDSIDALLYPRKYKEDDVRIDPIQLRQLFFSPKRSMQTAGGQIRRSDVARILPGAVVEYFITEEQIRAAFDISPNDNFNVDAIALHYVPKDPNWAPEEQGIYLSFEGDLNINIDIWGPMLIEDGAIVRIPASGVTFAASPYDPDPPTPWGGPSVVVSSVDQVGCGQIILMEDDVDVLVNNAGAIGPLGGVITTVQDVDGLTLTKKAPGHFDSPWTPGRIHHLWYSGRRLAGGMVLSTWGNGTMIPHLNSVPLANTAGPTTGEQVGLVPNAASLNGLALSPGDLPHFVTDSTTPGIIGMADVEVAGGDLPHVMAYVGANVADPIVDIEPPPGLPLPIHPGTFPEFFPPFSPAAMFGIAIDSEGCAQLMLPLPPLPIGLSVYFQSYLAGGPDVCLSAPLKME